MLLNPSLGLTVTRMRQGLANGGTERSVGSDGEKSGWRVEAQEGRGRKGNDSDEGKAWR